MDTNTKTYTVVRYTLLILLITSILIVVRIDRDNSDVIAIIDDIEITKNQLEEYLMPYKPELLRTMMEEMAIENKAKELGVVITNKQVDEHIEFYKVGLGEEYENIKSEYNLTEEGLRLTLRREALLNELKSVVTEGIEDEEKADEVYIDFIQETIKEANIQYR